MKTTLPQSLDEKTKKNVLLWLEGNYDEETKTTIRSLLKTDLQKIIDSFYTNLSFGTGGLRGIMGVGTNRMNQYTIAAATQGLANYLKKSVPPGERPSVVIGFDSRKNSSLFAEHAAQVLAANEIVVFLYQEIRPVPLVSFGCRYKKCSAGIMITASHNPPMYNGYKVYWNDGAQVLPPHDQGIIEEVNKIMDNPEIKVADPSSSLIHRIDGEVDKAYIKAASSLQHYPEENQRSGRTLSVVYSNLHGTGITLVPRILASWGFTNLSLVEEQNEPDGAFPTVTSPNPEEHQAMALGVKKLIQSGADIFLATDPDGDRIGVAVNHRGSAVLLNGNEVAAICVAHICKALTLQDRLPKKGAFIKTIVTTELFKTIAESYNTFCFDVLTGFKYIAQLIDQWEKDPNNGYQHLFSGEESYGYLLGTLTRDKDAIISCALLCEIALHAKLQNKDLVDILHDIYRTHGIYRESLLSVNFEEGKTGKKQMSKGMEQLRKHPPKTLGNLTVRVIEDYDTSLRLELDSGKISTLTLPRSNVLLFWLSNGTKLVVRPSGTEPKIKLYAGVVDKEWQENSMNLQNAIAHSDQQAHQLLQELKKLLQIDY